MSKFAEVRHVFPFTRHGALTEDKLDRLANEIANAFQQAEHEREDSVNNGVDGVEDPLEEAQDGLEQPLRISVVRVGDERV